MGEAEEKAKAKLRRLEEEFEAELMKMKPQQELPPSPDFGTIKNSQNVHVVVKNDDAGVIETRMDEATARQKMVTQPQQLKQKLPSEIGTIENLRNDVELVTDARVVESGIFEKVEEKSGIEGIKFPKFHSHDPRCPKCGK